LKTPETEKRRRFHAVFTVRGLRFRRTLVFGELFLLLSPGFQLVFDIGYSDKDRNKA
jgi:glycopeptide antibiotics resistance protein